MSGFSAFPLWATLVAVGVLGVRPSTTFVFSALLTGFGGVLAVASRPQAALALVGVAIAGTGLIIGAVGVRRDASRVEAERRGSRI